MTDDAELLRDYVETHSDAAFAVLVERHVNLVYSTALRMVRDAALAQDLVQSVFIHLARKAPAIRAGNALPGWLYRVTHCQAANALRGEQNRRKHEAEAMMHVELEMETAWESVGAELEDAMSVLKPDEQNLMVMRFFQNRSWRDVSAALALSEDTVQRRAGRALEKLRGHFLRKGVAVSAAVLGSVLAANAVQAAPAGLAASATAASLAEAGGFGSGVLALLKALLLKKSTCAVLAAALVAGISVPLAVATRSAKKPVTADALRKGLVLHLTFDDDETSTHVTDVSGRANHGKASGVRWTPDGKNGGAYQFNKDGDEIVVPNNKSLNPQRLTLSAWVKTTTKDAIWRRIFDKSYNKGYALSIAGEWQGRKWNGLGSWELGPGTHFSATKTTLADGQWHQVVATFDGTEQWLYVDGKPDGKPLRWEKPGGLEATDFNLVIGCNRSSLGDYDLGLSFRGLIDEPMMWNRALSAEEVALLFQSQNAPSADQTAAITN